MKVKDPFLVSFPAQTNFILDSSDCFEDWREHQTTREVIPETFSTANRICFCDPIYSWLDEFI
jgi:hypothetical protein